MRELQTSQDLWETLKVFAEDLQRFAFLLEAMCRCSVELEDQREEIAEVTIWLLDELDEKLEKIALSFQDRGFLI